MSKHQKPLRRQPHPIRGRFREDIISLDEIEELLEAQNLALIALRALHNKLSRLEGRLAAGARTQSGGKVVFDEELGIALKRAVGKRH